MVNLCIPTTVVETASAQFVQAWPKHRRDVTPQERAWLGEHLSRIPVSVTPLIRTTLSTSAVLALEPGEVRTLRVDLDKPAAGRSETGSSKPRWTRLEGAVAANGPRSSDG
jgi:flagellar motor switch protein FliM